MGLKEPQGCKGYKDFVVGWVVRFFVSRKGAKAQRLVLMGLFDVC